MSGLSMSLAMIASEDFVLFKPQPGVVIWSVAIFLVALPFMYKFVFGPIIRNLDARDKKVEDAARAAEDAKLAAERAVADAERLELAVLSLALAENTASHTVHLCLTQCNLRVCP